jgi:hypothetical protein
METPVPDPTETCGHDVPLSQDCAECKEYLGDEYHSPDEAPVVNFPGTDSIACKACNKTIEVGDPCVWREGADGFAHPTCAVPDA